MQSAPRSEVAFLRKVLIVAGVGAGAFVLWLVRDVILLAIAAVVIATLLVAASEPFQRYARLPRRWALLLSGTLILLALAGMALLVGAELREQVHELVDRLPDAARTIEERLGFPLIGDLPDASSVRELVSGDLASWMLSYGTTLLGGLSGIVLIAITGAFLAGDPSEYVRGAVKLFPKAQQARVEGALADCGRALRLWLIAQLVAMAIVGLLIGVGAWAVGLPGPLALGLFAALAEFVPVIGPIVGAVPALLLALTQGLGPFAWTLGLFLAVQQLESNVITPILEKRMVSLPPALLVLSVAAFGALFGIMGVIVAAPLTVVCFVLVKKLYVRETLGEATEVPGERR
ncbi:AI-2E family transporter [Arenibaculum pallidiluteum]|uniref:AI-2E family transporter n=1 Tax=Arenibaculum pallidiluteum TaxID=2812559 RepID=UPI001A9604CA|nr:AI-2E family transporter [Arenibaculum pallidiluteum]